MIVVAAGGVVLSAIYGPGAKKTGGLDPTTSVAQQIEAPADSAALSSKTTNTTPVAAAQGGESTTTREPLAALSARLPQAAAQNTATQSLGSLDLQQNPYAIGFARNAAGIDSITFSDFWLTARDREMAQAHRTAVAKGDANPPPMPPDAARYALHTLGKLQGFSVPILGARAIEINGKLVSLFGEVWQSVGAGMFETEVIDPDGQAVVKVSRQFSLPGNGYDMMLAQRVENVSGRPLKIRWIQYGPGDLSMDPGGMMDIRRFQFGYLYGPQRDPSRQNVIVHGAMFERADVLKRIAAQNFILWPQEEQRQQNCELSWFGTTNRYFALAVHAPDPTAKNGKSLGAIHEVWSHADALPAEQQVAFSELRSAEVDLAAGSSVSFDMGVFAGPLDPNLLEAQQPYRSLRMDGLILYLISGCCSFCTFSWLANLIVLLLTFLHDWVVFDWSLAIIVLVIVVRTLLHPVTKYSQVQMARVTKGMAAIKPELEVLQKRYAGDSKKLQAEQMRLYREKGVNPAGCVGGMLPTFLQMPIWIALYAVLYFAFELRQCPAFFGVFQEFGGWRFLSDLSSPDQFIEFNKPLFTWPFAFAGINLIPLLMAVVFFLQQKYMMPPSTGTLTPEQEQQQKMMKWMTVILFPIMLYTAPSGLTLYIMTSTCIGIIEGKRVRAQIERMDFTPKKRDPAKQDRLGKLYEAAMKRAREKGQQSRRFKGRD